MNDVRVLNLRIKFSYDNYHIDINGAPKVMDTYLHFTPFEKFTGNIKKLYLNFKKKNKTNTIRFKHSKNKSGREIWYTLYAKGSGIGFSWVVVGEFSSHKFMSMMKEAIKNAKERDLEQYKYAKE